MKNLNSLFSNYFSYPHYHYINHVIISLKFVFSHLFVWIGSLGWEDPLEKEMATQSSIRAWEIPWTEEPGGLQSLGLQRVGHHWTTNTYFLCLCILLTVGTFGGVCVLVAQLCLTVCNLPGSSVHGVLQARIMEWIAIPFSRDSSWPRDWTQVSCTAGRFFTVWATMDDRLCARHFSKYFIHINSFKSHNNSEGVTTIISSSDETETIRGT